MGTIFVAAIVAAAAGLSIFVAAIVAAAAGLSIYLYGRNNK